MVEGKRHIGDPEQPDFVQSSDVRRNRPDIPNAEVGQEGRDEEQLYREKESIALGIPPDTRGEDVFYLTNRLLYPHRSRIQYRLTRELYGPYYPAEGIGSYDEISMLTRGKFRNRIESALSKDLGLNLETDPKGGILLKDTGPLYNAVYDILKRNPDHPIVKKLGLSSGAMFLDIRDAVADQARRELLSTLGLPPDARLDSRQLADAIVRVEAEAGDRAVRHFIDGLWRDKGIENPRKDMRPPIPESKPYDSIGIPELIDSLDVLVIRIQQEEKPEFALSDQYWGDVGRVFTYLASKIKGRPDAREGLDRIFTRLEPTMRRWNEYHSEVSGVEEKKSKLSKDQIRQLAHDVGSDYTRLVFELRDWSKRFIE